MQKENFPTPFGRLENSLLRLTDRGRENQTETPGAGRKTRRNERPRLGCPGSPGKPGNATGSALDGLNRKQGERRLLLPGCRNRRKGSAGGGHRFSEKFFYRSRSRSPAGIKIYIPYHPLENAKKVLSKDGGSAAQIFRGRFSTEAAGIFPGIERQEETPAFTSRMPAKGKQPKGMPANRSRLENGQAASAAALRVVKPGRIESAPRYLLHLPAAALATVSPDAAPPRLNQSEPHRGPGKPKAPPRWQIKHRGRWHLPGISRGGEGKPRYNLPPAGKGKEPA